jgi:hypothetical protein
MNAVSFEEHVVFVFYMLEGYLIAIAENDPQSESLSAMAIVRK